MNIRQTDESSLSDTVRVQLLHVPDCPLIDRVRTVLRECLRQTSRPAVVEEFEGAYPSPTLLIDGIDAATGRPPAAMAGPCCRLDLPTRSQIRAALNGSTS